MTIRRLFGISCLLGAAGCTQLVSVDESASVAVKQSESAPTTKGTDYDSLNERLRARVSELSARRITGRQSRTVDGGILYADSIEPTGNGSVNWKASGRVYFVRDAAKDTHIFAAVAAYGEQASWEEATQTLTLKDSLVVELPAAYILGTAPGTSVKLSGGTVRTNGQHATMAR